MEDFTGYLKLVNNQSKDDPLLSSTSLGKHLSNVPLHYVKPSDIQTLSQPLNLEQLIPTESGLARDYRGLAELMGFGAAEIETRFKRSYNPTKSLIDAFISKQSFPSANNRRENPNHVSVNDLLKLIERIERFDVIDDFIPSLVQLAASYQPQHILSSNKLQLGEAAQLDESLTNITSLRVAVNSQHNQETFNNDVSRLTIDDSQFSRIIYDAFVCYAPEDFTHAQELIALMERHGKRMAVADDLLPGQFEFHSLAELIDSRCRKVIIILTPNFSRSKECEFQTKYASEVAIKAGYPKLIPVLYEACDDAVLPPMIRVISKIDMTNRSNTWQLNKLLRSLEFHNAIPNYSAYCNQYNRVNPTNCNNPQQLRDTSSNHIDQNGPPAIMFSSDRSQNVTPTPSLFKDEPIVDLSQSQSSSTMTATNLLPVDCSSRDTSPRRSSNTMRRLKYLKQKMLGKWSSLESISSQAMLIRPTSPELMPGPETSGHRPS